MTKKNHWPPFGDFIGSETIVDALALQVVVPLLRAANVEAEVGEADAIPRSLHERLLRLELEDLEHGAAGTANPADLAVGSAHRERSRRVDAEERPHAIGRRVGHADQRAAEDVPVKADELVEVLDSDADVAERSRSHLGQY